MNIQDFSSSTCEYSTVSVKTYFGNRSLNAAVLPLIFNKPLWQTFFFTICIPDTSIVQQEITKTHLIIILQYYAVWSFARTGAATPWTCCTTMTIHTCVRTCTNDFWTRKTFQKSHSSCCSFCCYQFSKSPKIQQSATKLCIHICADIAHRSPVSDISLIF